MIALLSIVALADPPDCNADAPACLSLGMQAFAANDLPEATRWFRAACTVENVHHCGPLLTRIGEGQSVVEAAEASCQKGAGRTCGRLGLLYLRAASPVGDPARAYASFEQACNRKVGWACRDAGRMAGAGEGTQRDATAAVAFAERACVKLKDDRGCLDLARRWIDGRGVAADPVRAAQILERGCEQGGGYACDERGRWAENGRAQQPDPHAALVWYRKGCLANRGVACFDLQRLLRTHTGSRSAATADLSKACAQGVRAACVAVSMLHDDGIVDFGALASSSRRQVGWAQEACQAGHAPACASFADAIHPVVRAQARVPARVVGGPIPSAPPLASLPATEGLRACLDVQLAQFADPELEGRGPNQEGQRIAAERLKATFEALGLQTEVAPLPADVDGAPNVAGTWPGAGALADEVVVLGAHYDHLGIDEDGVVHPGADDNASGVAGIVCIAEALRQALGSAVNRRTLTFIGFSAEELGFLGSAHWVAEHDQGSTVAMLNLDMIGRLRDHRVYLDSDAVGWEPLVAGAAAATGLRVERNSTPGRSDHVAFAVHGVPSVHLTTGVHGDYHEATDTLERLDVDGTVKVTRAAAAVAWSLAAGSPVPHLPPNVCTQPWSEPLLVGVPLESFRTNRWGDVEVRCVPENSPAAAVGLQARDSIDLLVGTDWPWSPVRLRVQRDGQCLYLMAGQEPEPCEPTAEPEPDAGDPGVESAP